ncbi:G patch domain-containing protein 2-like isoform X1 [Physella acuta]|uniref:G patch domain-containing protein 2-like isoform X1 n=1 Tax=Physella acuta TaxID=109671 RepID=UPI0027DCB656|nr:G patch domain-containing protein 2-like isoform X1 [Physella acuta]
MESNIVKDFENLKVYAQRNFIMDELVQDLTTALEETATVGRPGTSQTEGANSSTYPRRYVKKRRGIRRPSANSYYWKRGTISEASESSIDEHPIRDYAGNVIHSDSDDLAACQRIPKLTVPIVDSVPPVESDSFTENLSPLRPQRRRRKFKTMAVDSSPLTDPIPSDADSASGDRQFGKRKEESPSTTVDKASFSGLRCPVSSSMYSTSHSHAVTAGKRKRSSKSRTDYNYSDFPHQGISLNMDRMEVASVSQESSLSSSEFDSDLNANNEDAREADDEQSDFFHEPGPACGIPDIVPWWENERVTDEPLQIDSDFEKILTGTFAHLPKFSNQSFKARMGRLLSGTGREIRLGRRKLKGKMPRYTVGKFLQDREHWNRMQGHHPGTLLPGTCNNNTNNNSNGHGVEFKRRRHVPKSSTSIEGISGQCSDPVSETTVAAKLIRPSASGGMKSPVIAVRKSARKPGVIYANVSDS